MGFEVDQEYQKLISGCINLISIRPRSESEIISYINKKSNNLDNKRIIKKVISRLKELDYLDDYEFAKWWVKSRTGKTKPKGIHAIKRELKGKGVAKGTILTVISQYQIDSDQNSAISQVELARGLIFRKKKTWHEKTDIKLKRKVYSYLYMRGFSNDVINQIIDELT